MALARVDAMANRGQMQRESRNSRLAGFTVNSLLFPWSHSLSPVSMSVWRAKKKFTVLFTVEFTDLSPNSENSELRDSHDGRTAVGYSSSSSSSMSRPPMASAVSRTRW